MPKALAAAACRAEREEAEPGGPYRLIARKTDPRFPCATSTRIVRVGEVDDVLRRRTERVHEQLDPFVAQGDVYVIASAALGPPEAGVELGPGDDAAVIGIGEQRIVLNVDRQSEGVHFRRDWLTASELFVRLNALR